MPTRNMLGLNRPYIFQCYNPKKSDSTRQIRYQGAQIDITLRDSLQKLIALHKARSVYL
mgnify:FL=1